MSVTILDEQYEVGSRMLITTRGTKPPVRNVYHEGLLLGWYENPLTKTMYLQLERMNDGGTTSILAQIIHDVDVLFTPRKEKDTQRPGQYKKRPVIETTTGRKYKSVREACKITGLHPMYINDVLSGKKPSVDGLVFRYLEE